jgi:hypothetical protein
MDQSFGKYLFEYYHDGAQWSIVIPASSEEDAKERIRKLPYARLLGTLDTESQVHSRFSARLICWWRNFLDRRKSVA